MFVVERDRDCRITLGDVLHDEGFLPVLFREPREAVASLASVWPALIVTDLWRPGALAAAPFSALLASAASARLPVVVFSGWNRTAAELTFPVPFVPKPEIRALLR